MTINSIIKRLEKAGYRVAKSMSTGNVVVKSSRGCFNVFSSYQAAYRFYFR